MSPEDSTVPQSGETELPTGSENLARLAALKERSARQRPSGDYERGWTPPGSANFWPRAIPIALCIMAIGNILLLISRFTPPNLHASGTSFALVMTAYFITAVALIRGREE